jgi:NitT/TauT family transport system substrate-binding protein
MKRAIMMVVFMALALYISYPVFAQDGILNIGYQPSTHQIAEMVAMEKGWWKDELKPFGITDVKEFQFPTGAPEMQAMLAGDLDVAYVGTAPPITAISQGLDAKIVAAVNINGSNLVLRPDIEYVGPESLSGLSIATFPPGTIQDLVLKKWLKDSGVDISQVDIKAMGPGDAITAISAGKVDGVFLPHPSPAIIEDEGKGSSVVASGEMWPNHACCSLVVSGKLIRESPELVKQIIRIHNNATDYINEHPDEAAEIYARKTGQDIDQVKKSVLTWDGKWISDPHEEIPSTLEYAAEDYELKYIEKSLSEKDLFDTSFYDSIA